MRNWDQTPEEREAGLIRIGEIYQDIESPHAEIYIRVKSPAGVVAYLFRNPENLWLKVLRWCSDCKPMEEE